MSIVNQSIEAGEIIIVDDCSVDGTVELIKSLNIRNLIVLVNPVNSGPSYCRNIGIKMSKFEWVAFLDSDDIWHPRKIQFQLMAAKEHDADLVSCRFQVHDKFEEAIYFSNKFDKVPTLISFNRLIFNNSIATPSVLVNKRIEYIFNPSLRLCEDLDLWLRISRRYKAVMVENSLVSIYRPSRHSGLSSKLLGMELAELKVLFSHVGHNPFLISFSLCFSFLKFIKRLCFRYLPI